MKRIITLTFFVLAFTVAASAFSTKYHATVAYIAEQHMTPKAKSNFRKAFGNRPLVYFASYPDFYRDIYNINGTPITHSIYLDEDFNPVSKRDEKISAYDALLWAVEQLKDYKAMDDSLRVVALAMVAHFAGDSHCPSHKNYADKRGRIRDIFCTKSLKNNGKGQKVSYHAFWDAFCMDQRYVGGFMDVAYMIDTCTKEEIAGIQQGSIEDWMHATAVDCKDLYDVGDGATVDRIYVTDKAELAVRQVRNAGYRLAALMNRIFG